MDGVNEFLIAQKDTPYPYLVMLVCGPYAYVSLIPEEDSAGQQVYNDTMDTDLDPDECTIFYTNTPTEELEIYNDYVISRPLAERIALEFAETGKVPEDVAWEEL